MTNPNVKSPVVLGTPTAPTTGGDSLVEARFLGTRVHAATPAILIERISTAISTRTKLLVGNHNLHSLALVQDSSSMRRFYEKCQLIFCDGMPVVAIAILLGYPFRMRNRFTSLDFIDGILARSATNGWRIFYLGSRPGIAEQARERWTARHPGLQMMVTDGYFDADPQSDEARTVVQRIAEFGPDLVIVGMGMPRQEEWVSEFADSLEAPVFFPIGALADYVAGVIPTPPRWAGRIGLEWVFRLMAEPRRLAARYLVEPVTLAGPLLREIARRLPLSRQR